MHDWKGEEDSAKGDAGGSRLATRVALGSSTSSISDDGRTAGFCFALEAKVEDMYRGIGALELGAIVAADVFKPVRKQVMIKTLYEFGTCTGCPSSKLWRKASF